MFFSHNNEQKKIFQKKYEVDENYIIINSCESAHEIREIS